MLKFNFAYFLKDPKAIETRILENFSEYNGSKIRTKLIDFDQYFAPDNDLSNIRLYKSEGLESRENLKSYKFNPDLYGFELPYSNCGTRLTVMLEKEISGNQLSVLAEKIRLLVRRLISSEIS